MIFRPAHRCDAPAAPGGGIAFGRAVLVISQTPAPRPDKAQCIIATQMEGRP